MFRKDCLCTKVKCTFHIIYTVFKVYMNIQVSRLYSNTYDLQLTLSLDSQSGTINFYHVETNQKL